MPFSELAPCPDKILARLPYYILWNEN